MHLVAAVDQVGRPDQLGHVDAEALALDQVQRIQCHAVEADAVAAILYVFACEQVRGQVGEDVFFLQLDDHLAATRCRYVVVEGLELLGKQRCDVDVEADLAGDRDRVGLGQHGQHAPVQRLGEVLEQPAIGDQVDARQQGFAQVLDRDEEFGEMLHRHHLGVDLADELAAHQVGKIGAFERGFDPRQHFRRQRLALLLLGLERGARIHPRTHGGLALLLGLGEGLRHSQDVLVVLVGVEPAGEGVRLQLLLGDQRVVVEQESDLLHDGLDLALCGGFVDEEQVRVLEDEELAGEVLDQRFEVRRGGADVLVAAVERAQPREMQMHDLAPSLVLLEPAHVIEQQVFLRGQPFLAVVLVGHGPKPSWPAARWSAGACRGRSPAPACR